MNIVDYMERLYPHPSIYAFFRSQKKQLNNWRDIVELIADYHKGDDLDMCVSKSSSWAVCQEFLGKLDIHELRYVEGRAGIWSIAPSVAFDVDGYPQVTTNIVTTRDIISDILQQFP